VVAVPPSGVPEDVPNGVDAFLAQHLHEAGNAITLYLFQGLQVWKGISHSSAIVILSSIEPR
jgi:hypothetical protein